MFSCEHSTFNTSNANSTHIIRDQHLQAHSTHINSDQHLTRSHKIKAFRGLNSHLMGAIFNVLNAHCI